MSACRAHSGATSRQTLVSGGKSWIQPHTQPHTYLRVELSLSHLPTGCSDLSLEETGHENEEEEEALDEIFIEDPLGLHRSDVHSL